MKRTMAVLGIFLQSMLLHGGEKKPDGAVQLIGDKGLQHLIAEKGGGELPWPFKNGVLTVNPESGTSAVTAFPLGDFKAHIEFKVNEREGKWGNNGNSGVYIQQSYELQILNSFERKDQYTTQDCASIYKVKMPDKKVCRPAGEWQAYDIDFKAARWDGEKKTAHAVLSVVHNGVLVHDRVELKDKTGNGKAEAPGLRPLRLQNHGNPVEFRNFWIMSEDFPEAEPENIAASSEVKKAKPADGENLFKTNCLACHQPVDAMVGPSLAEISEIYKKDPEGIIKWAVKPGFKRKSGIPMPPMAFVGEKNLGLIADYMLKEGKKYRKVKKKSRPEFIEKLGVVQRVFMPDSGPASISVTLPNGISYCWDTGTCYLRYFWEGTLNPNNQFISNGNSMPSLSSPAFHTVAAKPFSALDQSVSFKGYELDVAGLPVFYYTAGELVVKEYLRVQDTEIHWNYNIKGESELTYHMPDIEGYVVTADKGRLENNLLTLKPEEMQHFTITLRKE